MSDDARASLPLRKKSATCIGCGCRDYYLYSGIDAESVDWLRLDREKGFGVCSECDELVQGWDQSELAAATQSPAELARRVRVGRLKRCWGIRHLRYWLISMQLHAWAVEQDGPGACLEKGELEFLDAVWRGEA